VTWTVWCIQWPVLPLGKCPSLSALSGSSHRLSGTQVKAHTPVQWHGSICGILDVSRRLFYWRHWHMHVTTLAQYPENPSALSSWQMLLLGIWKIQWLLMKSSHWYNIMVKLTKSLQFWHISHRYLNLWRSTTRISMRRISTSAQNYHIMKNKHWSIQAKLTQFLYFQLFHHNLAHSLAHCLAHKLSIARYCFRFAPPLHSCITYCFFICDAPK
jgi:hypothetical protein